MSVRVIVGLLVILLVVLFTVQNTEPVALHLLVWQLSAPAALVVALAFASGMLVGALFFWTEQRRMQRKQPVTGTAAPTQPVTAVKKKQSWWW